MSSEPCNQLWFRVYQQQIWWWLRERKVLGIVRKLVKRRKKICYEVINGYGYDILYFCDCTLNYVVNRENGAGVTTFQDTLCFKKIIHDKKSAKESKLSDRYVYEEIDPFSSENGPYNVFLKKRCRKVLCTAMRLRVKLIVGMYSTQNYLPRARYCVPINYLLWRFSQLPAASHCLKLCCLKLTCTPAIAIH